MRARVLLEDYELPYVYLNLSTDPVAKSDFKQLKHTTVPQVYTQDASGNLEYIGGFEALDAYLKKTDS